MAHPLGHWSLVICLSLTKPQFRIKSGNPASAVNGHRSLVIGRFSFVFGHLSLFISHWSLVIGN